MFRIQSSQDQADQVKDALMECMEDYLMANDGYFNLLSKLINIKILKNYQICCYFVTGSND